MEMRASPTTRLGPGALPSHFSLHTFTVCQATPRPSPLCAPIEVRLAVEQPCKASFAVSVRPPSAPSRKPSPRPCAPFSHLRLQKTSSAKGTTCALLFPQSAYAHAVRRAVACAEQTGTDLFGVLLMQLCPRGDALTLAPLNAGSVPMARVVCATAVARVSASDLRDRCIINGPAWPVRRYFADGGTAPDQTPRRVHGPRILSYDNISLGQPR
ncbi:hypothetical protein FA95DRAFT_631689 [Auriscalpium vulgare]|uniref:Uncharacterized protein n=1 Tax=Auriscalpium vulgare TaxID=40419 RepID=A0ACB8RDP1_9AGAM|nr:hypothetical protein FA95DRAFT_631689 [Auriscalpium vulgare]